MSLTIYDISVPPLLRGLSILSTYLDHAQAFCVDQGIAEADMLNARLTDDMLNFTGQVQRASDSSKGGAARLSGSDIPSYADTEASFDELRERIARTIHYIQSIPPEDFEDAELRAVEMRFRSVNGVLSAPDYVLQVLLPNFFFHITTAHAILRHRKVPIGKRNYFGELAYLPDTAAQTV
jgi:hypothetical protein